ncbi:hypothetical protein FRC12_022820 [Ceratobasidium sp. 428]|nr:hypothetical protein FRC09_002560 [Ceratobasidium sp. 395]KAG8780566.1 hypothetical protein FRC12_022820 [Ceratobasidium sp. 428]
MSLMGKRQNVMTPTPPSGIPKPKKAKTTDKVSHSSTVGETPGPTLAKVPPKSSATPSAGGQARNSSPTGSVPAPKPQTLRLGKDKAPVNKPGEGSDSDVVLVDVINTRTDVNTAAGPESSKPKKTNATASSSNSKSDTTKATPASKPKPAKTQLPKPTPKVVLPKVTPAKGTSKGSKAANTSNEGTVKKGGRRTRASTKTADSDYEPDEDEDDIDEDDRIPASKSLDGLVDVFKNHMAIHGDTNRIAIASNLAAAKEHRAQLEILQKQNDLVTNIGRVADKFGNDAAHKILEGVLFESRKSVKSYELKMREQATALKEAEVRLAAYNEQVLLLTKEKEDRQNKEKKSEVDTYWEMLNETRGDQAGDK